MAATVVSLPIKYLGAKALFSGEINACGQPHGYGEQIIISKGPIKGHLRIGMHLDGHLRGVCKFVHPSGEKGIGEFSIFCLEGVGFYEYPHGARYAGQFKSNKKHGFGTYTSNEGIVVIGWFADDDVHGVVLFSYPDGSKGALTYEHGKVVAQSTGFIFDACICSD
jgi:hypothetical protein